MRAAANSLRRLKPAVRYGTHSREIAAEIVIEPRQFDAVCAHHPGTAKLEPLSELEDGPPLRQRGKGRVRRQCRRVSRKGVRDPGRGDLTADDALTRIGLEPIDPRRLLRQPLPDGQQQARHDVNRGFRELGDLGKLREPSCGEAITIRLDPMAFRQHRQGSAVLLHRPDQADAPLDLAVIEHKARSRELYGGPSRALVDQQDGARMRKKIDGVSKLFTLDACRHGGMTELEEAELTDGQGRALSGHKTAQA